MTRDPEDPMDAPVGEEPAGEEPAGGRSAAEAQAGGGQVGSGRSASESAAESHGDRRVGFLRRVLLHLALGLWTTPLVGGILVAARAAQARRLRRWLLPGGIALVCLALGLLLALFLPWPRRSVTLLILAFWLAGGAANAWGERRAEVAPRADEAPGPLRVQVALWALAVVVAWGAGGFFLAGLVTPWGAEVLLKPFFSRSVLWVTFVVFLPVGLLVGLVQGLLRRPLRPAAPVVFSLCGVVLLLAVTMPALLYEWIVQDLAKIESQYVFDTPLEGPWLWVWTGSLLFYGVAFLVGSVYLGEATGVRDFLRRGLVVAGLGLLMSINSEVLDHSRVLDFRAHRALQAAEAEEPLRAARLWWWQVRRLGDHPGTARSAMRGAREALLARDPALARRLLESVDETLAARYHIASSRAIAEAVLERLPTGEGELGPVHAAEVAPVRKESYLSATWAALLTAIRAARPDLGETALKLRLLDLSQSSQEIVLGKLDTVRDLDVRARFFDTELVAFPFRHLHEALRRGVPVLYRNPHGSGWHLLFWSHPASGAAIEIDYDLWQATDGEALERSEVEQLVAGDEDVERYARRILARISRLQSESRVEEWLEREGGWALAVVTPEARDEMSTALQAPPAALDELMILEDAWALYRQDAYRRALELLASRPVDARAEELLAVMWLEEKGREVMDPEIAERARRANERLLSAEGLQEVSWNALRALRRWTGSLSPARPSDPTLCRWRLPVAEASARRYLQTREARKKLLRAAIEDRRTADAVAQARALWRRTTGDAESLEIAASLAAMPGAAEEPALRALLTEIRLQVGLVVEVEDGYRFRRWLAEHWAIQAALATDDESRRRCWRRACELDPRNPAYFERRAEAEDAAGDAEAAQQARTRALALTPIDYCSLTKGVAL